MASINQNKKTDHVTHEGAPAKRINTELELRRSIMACMLWEDAFYESGEAIAERINSLIAKIEPQKVSQIAIEAREKMKLRHVPLLIVREMARLPQHKALVSMTLERVIQRADELTEFLAIYWKDKRQPLSAQVKKGLAKAFPKFSAYDLAKYNRDGAIKLRDVLFLTKPKSKDEAQAETWKKLVNKTLESPDTWEVELSAGKDKKSTWERLLSEKKLGPLALLRNLRNMKEAGVTQSLIFQALEEMKVERVLPFRFISAARYAPQWEPQLEKAMFKCLASMEKLPGRTAIVIDNSGSMVGAPVSARSEIDRSDAACALAILVREICEDCVVIAFSDRPTLIPARRGFALRDAIKKSPSGGTMTENPIQLAKKQGYDRIIVITDEQSHQTISGPDKKGYFINVSTNQNGIGYGKWLHIDGWSEAVIDYIREFEKSEVPF